LESRHLRFFCTSGQISHFPDGADQGVKYTGSILSRDDLIQLEGKVTRILGFGIMEVHCDKDLTVRGRLSGRMKKYRIKVMVGDHVKVSVSPYDTSHGLITYRMK
jgi:translation initiation factor IF-1